MKFLFLCGSVIDGEKHFQKWAHVQFSTSFVWEGIVRSIIFLVCNWQIYSPVSMKDIAL